MSKKMSSRIRGLTAGDISAVIQMAWEDRTSFETIKTRSGLCEAEVVQVMRTHLRTSSFKMWRVRTKGRITKHRKLRPSIMKFSDFVVADHRRANC